MTRSLLQHHWSQIRADSRRYWGKLTDEDLDRIAGQYEAFVQALRRRYGYSPLKAEDELERFLFCYSDGPRAVEAVAYAEVRA